LVDAHKALLRSDDRTAGVAPLLLPSEYPLNLDLVDVELRQDEMSSKKEDADPAAETRTRKRAFIDGLEQMVSKPLCLRYNTVWTK
jgi:hypothetical protein